MIYRAYDFARRQMRPLAAVLDAGRHLASHELNPWRQSVAHRTFGALCDVSYRQLREYPKRPFSVRAPTQKLPLEEEVVHELPFADLVHFRHDDDEDRPKVLIAAALSGHHATLLRDTVRGFVRDFDTYITDWKDAKAVPSSEGDFGLDDYIAYLVEFIEQLGPEVHLVATCQAAPPAMVAAAILAKRNPALVPATITLMAGPVDIRVNKNIVGKAADSMPLPLVRAMNVMTVPPGFPGSGRRVYPGFYQLTAFITMNLGLHLRRHGAYVFDSIRGNENAAEAFRSFYDEYYTMLDATESFYMETLQRIFVEHHIPTNRMTFRGEHVDFSLVEDSALLTVEGENDDLCAVGQTEAAHDILTGIREHHRYRHVQRGVGHYGIFSGSKFQNEVYPVIRDFILDVTRAREARGAEGLHLVAPLRTAS